MLDAVDSGEQARRRVIPPDRDSLLQDDRAMVPLFVDEVHRDPGDLRAPSERVADRVRSGESRQQRRVDVQDAVAKAPDEDR